MKQSITKYFPGHITFLAQYYLLGLFYLWVFRYILFVQYHLEHSEGSVLSQEIPFQAFKIGWQFDTVILSYVLVLPFLFLGIASFIKIKPSFYKWSFYYISVLLAPVFMISSADIPFFNYTFGRLSAVIFLWMSNLDIVTGMITQEKSYFFYVLLFFLFYGSFVWIGNKILRRTLEQNSQAKRLPIVFSSISFILVFFLLFLGSRGRLDSPIRINHSFYCNNAFNNQLGLNPSFVLIKSALQDNSVKLMDEQKAVNQAVKFLKAPLKSNYNSPISRPVVFSEAMKKKNIVLILMESMSASKLRRFGNEDNLAPFLDSLADCSLSFEHIYSAGFHTRNGIFSTLYSFPSILRESPMSSVDQKPFSSIPKVLKDNGYINMYFATHSETFDNVGGFLPYNHFDKIISQKDYDPEKIQSTFGVPDHILFEYAIQHLDSLSKQNKPFFATIMTVSDHGPYIIPAGIDFKPHTQNIKNQIVEYADWSLRQFIETAQTKNWFNNTLFLFVADHGVIMGDLSYDIPQSLHHIPFVIYAADTTLVPQESNLTYGTQMDVLPTVMGLLNASYLNNTLGVDLRKEPRPYSYFSSDDKFACIGDSLMYIYKISGKQELLYAYKSGRKDNLIQEKPKEAEEMRNYLFSMIQTAKWIIQHDKTTEAKPE